MLSGAEPVRLLVIEDEDRLSAILESKLGDVGFTVDIAGSAADGGAAIELINYDAAFSTSGCPTVMVSLSWPMRGGLEKRSRF